MHEELEKTVKIFREHYIPDSVEPMVIYGTGLLTEAVVTSCADYPIEGLMDAARTGETLWGKKVLSEAEAKEAGIRLVVVAARPAVHTIIYKRLQKWSEQCSVRILDIQGNDISEKGKKKIYDSPYFEKSYEQLLQEIDRHDVISFDIFDTLLTRKVYEPRDVFALLDCEYKDKYPFVFSIERELAQQELSRTEEPDIHQIYRKMRENNPCLSSEECETLKEREIWMERQILTPRRRMLDFLKYCVEKGKIIYLVTDMYLPEKILEGILRQFGVTRYHKLFVSCEYKVTKQNGLFQEMKRHAPSGCTYLHIGDHPVADGEMARKNGIDDFGILSPLRMMELSSYSQLLVHVEGLEGRIMLGLLMSEVFQDPFAMYHSGGKPKISMSKSFGYVFLAPLILSFMVWMLGQVKGDRRAAILFSARDGWLPEQLYRMMTRAFRLSGLPESNYLLISRRAVLQLDEPDKWVQRKRYQKYLEDFHLEAYERVYFFDFMSRGTCQYHLEKLLHRELQGLYFQKSKSGEAGKDALAVKRYYKEENAVDSERHIFGVCDFLECILTAFTPSFIEFSEEFQPIYEEERRTKEQIACVRDIQEGIKDYCRQFTEILTCLPEQMPPVDFCDEMLQLMGADYSRIAVLQIKEMILDDAVCKDKNTGRDALM